MTSQTIEIAPGPTHQEHAASRARSGVRWLLEMIGEDPNREGLLDTPKRVVKAWMEMTEGYQLHPAEILATSFGEHADEMILVDGINFTSCCEHHLLPFTGTARVAYMPAGGRVVGLSKIPRLVDCFAKRLQIQERLTQQIADALDHHIQPAGVAVLIKAHHSCCSLRGVRKPNTEMVTSTYRGVFKTEAEAKAQFLGLLK